jgi:hypothetical protein
MMNEKKYGYEVVRVRGNMSITIATYNKNLDAEAVRDALIMAEPENCGKVKCQYKIRKVRIY